MQVMERFSLITYLITCGSDQKWDDHCLQSQWSANLFLISHSTRLPTFFFSITALILDIAKMSLAPGKLYSNCPFLG